MIDEKIIKDLNDVKNKILVGMISFSSIKESIINGPFKLPGECKMRLTFKIKVKTLTDLEMSRIEKLIFKNETKNVDITMLIPDSNIVSFKKKNGYKNYKNKNMVVFYLEQK